MGADLLVAAEALLRGTRDPKAVALWTGYRPGVLDAIALETFVGLLDREVDGHVAAVLACRACSSGIP
jgi:hypothetical protein